MEETSKGDVLERDAEGSIPRNGFKTKRYAILVTGRPGDDVVEKHGDFADMFERLLRENQREEFDRFDAMDRTPSVEEMLRYDAIVITGSKNNAHASDAWIERLCELLRVLHEHRARVLGICFGHQILARALGGITGRARTGWELGISQSSLTPAFEAKWYADALKNKEPRQKLILHQIHQDQVSEIPAGGELLAYSVRCPIEMFAVGDHILGIQGHPEMDESVILDLIASYRERGELGSNLVERALTNVKNCKADFLVSQTLCRRFLKGASHRPHSLSPSATD